MRAEMLCTEIIIENKEKFLISQEIRNFLSVLGIRDRHTTDHQRQPNPVRVLVIKA